MYSLKNKRQSEHTADPSKYPQGYFKDKVCKYCGSLFQPSAPSHLYCSDHCADTSLSCHYLKRNYGMTYKQYQEMLIEQDSKCFLCGGPGFLMNKERHKLALVVDHCHETGKVRGLLCHNCNRALGLFKDNPDVLIKAAEYVRKVYNE
jgi:hypothetical protein